MTLTTFLNNKIGGVTRRELGVLYRWALKRNRAVITVYSIFLAVCGPLFNMYILAQTDGADDEVGIVSLGVYVSLAALFTLISAIKSFSFLHNKRSVDMYGALPCNRTTLFVSHFLAGITAIGVPYLIAAIVTMGISVRSVEAIKFCTVTVLSTLLMILAAYIFTTLMAYCCGTVADTVISTIAVNGIWMAAVACYFGFMGALIPGVTFDSIINTPLLTAFAPYGFGYMGMYSYATGYFDDSFDIAFFVSFIIWSLIFIAITGFATLLLANRRKAESSQNGFAVRWLPMAVKAGASVIAGALLGIIFAEISDNGFGNMFAYVFWYIVGSAIAFIVLHIVFARGIKKGLKKSAIVYSVTSVASIVLVFCMCYGMGIDTHVPYPSNVKSVAVGNYQEYVFKEPENIETVTEIHKVITEGIRNENGYPYYFGHEDIVYDLVYETNSTETNSAETYVDPQKKYPFVNYFSYKFNYNMKFGFDMNREYYIYSGQYNYYDIEKLNELTAKLISSEEYKRMANPYLFDEEFRSEKAETEEITDIQMSYYTYSPLSESYSQDGYEVLRTDENFLNGLYEALQKDILADTEYVPSVSSNFSDIIGDKYMEIEFTCKVDTQKLYGYTSSQANYNYYGFTVKSDYKNTLDYLSKYEFEYVPGVNYYNNYDNYYGNYYGDYEPKYNYDYYNDTEIYNAIDNYSWSGMRSDWFAAVSSCLEPMAKIACSENETDYDTWYNDYYSDFSSKIYTEADKLYKELLLEHGAQEDDIYCPYVDEIFEMVDELTDFAVDYVKNCETDTDTSDTESSDTDSSAAGNASADNSDTDSSSKTSSTSREV